jgi:hypothetical protein
MDTPASNPFVAGLLARLNANLHNEFTERIGQLEFASEFPNRLLLCIGLLDVLRNQLSQSE